MCSKAMCSHHGPTVRERFVGIIVLFCATLFVSLGALAQAPSFVALRVRTRATHRHVAGSHATCSSPTHPDNTLEVFDITLSGLALRARVPVGLEPVAVAARNDAEVWVVNHLSDSISVVTLERYSQSYTDAAWWVTSLATSSSPARL